MGVYARGVLEPAAAVVGPVWRSPSDVGSTPVQRVLPDQSAEVGTYGKFLEARYDDRMGANVLVAQGTPLGDLVRSDVPADVTFLAGVGTEKSTLQSMAASAARFQVVQEPHATIAGKLQKRVTRSGQPVRVGVSALAWPFHGGPNDPAMADLSTLMQWLESYVLLTSRGDQPKIAIGRSFGGTALLELALRNDACLNRVVAVSPYTPAWTGYVLRELSALGRQFNLPGWQWVLQLDGMMARNDTTAMTSERFAALTAQYGALSVSDYWDTVRGQSQWTFPERLAARLAQLRTVDPEVDGLWNQDWRRLGEDSVARCVAGARALREAAGFVPLQTDVTILFGEQDHQYPQSTGFPVAIPEQSVRAYWQAFAVAFGMRIMGVPTGHDPLNGSSSHEGAINYVYGLIRDTVDRVARG